MDEVARKYITFWNRVWAKFHVRDELAKNDSYLIMFIKIQQGNVKSTVNPLFVDVNSGKVSLTQMLPTLSLWGTLPTLVLLCGVPQMPAAR